MDFSIFTDAQLEANVARLNDEFRVFADGEYLSAADSARKQRDKIRAELVRRAEQGAA